MTGEEVLFKAVALLIMFFLAQRRINTFIQPLRLRMVALGNELTADERLPEHYRFGVEYEMDFAYSPWNLVLSIVFLPVAALQMAINPKARNMACAELDAMPEDLRRKLELFLDLANKSMYAANPLLSPVFFGELLLVGAGVVLMGRTERAFRVIMTNAWESEDRMMSRISGYRHNHAT